MENEQQVVLSLLKSPECCRILRSLIFKPDGLSLAELSTRTNLSEPNCFAVLNNLFDAKLVQVCSQSKSWSFLNTLELRPVIDKAIFEFELGLVTKRALSANHYARQKIEAIDQLADHISSARVNVRS